MTSDQVQAAERCAALTAVAHALTDAESVEFMHGFKGVTGQSPAGMTVAGVLLTTVSMGQLSDKTVPFFERFGDQVPECEGNAAAYAACAILLLGLELAPARLASLLQRAGVTEAPRYPDVEIGLCIHDKDVGGAPCRTGANHLLLMARAEQGLRAAGVDEYEITQFRAAVRETPLPGYSRNVADIAAWVTLVDRYTPLPRKAYDPLDDLAVILAGLYDLPLSRAQLAAEANLRSHLDMSTTETIKTSLAGLLGRTEGL